LADRFESQHDVGGLSGVRARTSLEIDVRLRKVQFVEENPGELNVIVLACVDQPALQPNVPIAAAGVMGIGRPDQGRDFHEIRARTCDKKKFERAGRHGDFNHR
jgi:hypothetical protein